MCWSEEFFFPSLSPIYSVFSPLFLHLSRSNIKIKQTYKRKRELGKRNPFSALASSSLRKCRQFALRR